MKRIFSLIIFFLIFSAISILLSLWLGLIWRNSLFILLVSLVISYFIFKKFPFTVSIPLRIYFLGFLAFLMATYPLLLIHPFYSASADSAPTMATIVIGDKIPATYAPYSNLSYRYEIGLPLFAKIIVDLVPTTPPYIIVWFLSALFIFLQLILVYILARLFFNSERAGEWAAILFIGSKVAFQSMYSGEYAWLMATVFFLATIVFFLSKSKLAYLFLPLVFIIHPGPALNILLFFAIFFLFFRQEITKLLSFGLSLVLAIPSFFITYLHMLWNTLFGGVHTFSMSFMQILRLSFIAPLWIGVVPFAAAVAGIFCCIKQMAIDRKKLILISLLCVSIFLNIFFASLGSLIGAKVIELAVFSSILLGAIFLTELKIDKTKYSSLAKTVIIIFCLFFFFSSTTLNHFRSGSKITPDEAEFALKFKEIDPEPGRTLFLSNNGGKMAEISNKIPFDVNHNWFLPYNRVLIQNDPMAEEFYTNSKKWREIIDNNCISCIYDLNVDYVVINKEFFSYSLQEEPIFSHKQFDLYKLRN